MTGNIRQFDKEAFRLAVRRGVQGGKVAVFWNLASRLFVADCFYPGCTEGALDSDFLFPYLWQPYLDWCGDQQTFETMRMLDRLPRPDGDTA